MTATTSRRWTLADIKAANERAGFYFFSRSTMRFFGDTMRNFGVRHVNGRVYVVRNRPGYKMPAGYGWDEKAWREFDPETGDIGLPQAGPTD